ncbi:MAG: hypothetical protein QOF11_1924 [Chloroflexota bacterium]|jgi:uncharacterized membrane protein YkvA (DUF1232 family)|nr:hypothetical protein [Chloroflexota bacterium]
MDPLAALLVAALLAAGAWSVLVAVLWLHRPSRELAGFTIRLVPDLVRLVRALLADGTTPRSVKAALVGLLFYLLSPFDLVPDFLPVIGSLDDLILSALVLRWAGRRVGLEGLRAHWSGSQEGFALLLRLLGVPAPDG